MVCAQPGSVQKIETLREFQETLAVLPGSHRSQTRSHSSQRKGYVGATAAVFDLLDLAVFHPFLVSLHEDLLVDPVQADLVLVTDWLYRPADSLESHLARTVLSSLDWAVTTGLSYDQHVTTAVTVVEAAMAHSCPSGSHLGSSHPGYGLVTMTNIAAAVRQTPEQAFAEWAWEMLSRLHLHMMDLELT